MERSDTHLLRPAEVALRLGVSRSWLYEAAKSGRIPCVRLGGDDGPVRFLQDDLERWLERARREWLPGDRPASRVAGAPNGRTHRAALTRIAHGPPVSEGSEQLSWPLLAPADAAG